MKPKIKWTFTRHDRKLVIGGAVIMLLALVLFLSLPALVDTAAIEAELKTSFKKATGLDLEIQDGMVVSIFPTPHVVIRNLYVSNVPGASTSFMLSMHTMDIRLRTSSLLSSHPVTESVAVDGVVLELERLKNGRMNWQEMAQYIAAGSPGKISDGAPATPKEPSEKAVPIANISDSATLLIGALSKMSSVTLSNSEIHFTDSQLGLVTNYTDINVSLSSRSQQSKLDVSMSYGDLPVSLKVEMGDLGEALSAKSTTAKVHLESGDSFLNYEGEISLPESLALKGKMDFESKDMTRWIKLLNGHEQTGKPAGKVAIPLKLTGDVITEGKKIVIPAMAVTGNVFMGTLNAALNSSSAWDIKGTLDTMDFDAILASGVFTSKSSSADDKKSTDNDSAPAPLSMVPKKSLWSYLNFSVDVRATDVSFNHGKIKNGHIEFDMSDGDMTISQISGVLPGEAKLLFTGLGKEGYQGFMIDGQLDGSGENFVEMVNLFREDTTQAVLPIDYKRFRFKTNMVLSSKELRFTELTSRIENTAVVGGIISTFGEGLKIQSAVRVGGVDLDRFFMLWGVHRFRDELITENMMETKTDTPLAAWLKGLSYELDIRASLEQYTLNGRQQERSKFRLSAVKNKITLTEVEMSIGDTQVAGKLLLDVEKTLPFIDVEAAADVIDVSSLIGSENLLFDAPDPGAPKGGPRKWSHRGMNFQWLDHINCKFRFKVGMIKSGDVEVTGFDIRGAVEDRILNLPAFAGQIQGAKIAGKGFVKGGKIPSASVTGDLNGLDVAYLLDFMPALHGMSGKYNTHFRLNTSGIDVYTWLYNMDGNVSIASRDVTVEGFNLPAIITAVGYVRTVADILDAVKRAYPGGSTVFNVVDGEWTVANGVFKVPSLKLKNDMAEGEFTGQVDLIQWKMVGHLSLALTYLDRATPPKMSINYSGSLDSVDKELDTRLLEQYVANKTSEKLLQQGEGN